MHRLIGSKGLYIGHESNNPPAVGVFSAPEIHNLTERILPTKIARGEGGVYNGYLFGVGAIGVRESASPKQRHAHGREIRRGDHAIICHGLDIGLGQGMPFDQEIYRAPETRERKEIGGSGGLNARKSLEPAEHAIHKGLALIGWGLRVVTRR